MTPRDPRRIVSLVAATAIACTTGGAEPSTADVGTPTETTEPTTGASTSDTTSTTSASTTATIDAGVPSTTSESSADPDSSTGSPTRPAVTLALVTDDNRHHPEMHGGWGPQLRAPMLDDSGTLWFAYDGGPSVLVNTTIHYARRGDDGWETVASQLHTGGVQQNAAHVLRDTSIVSYAVDVAGHFVEACVFDVVASAPVACNAIQIGGPYATPPSSNYVGAALGPAGETVVWFTVVGDAGGTGQFVYTYDYGGGWNGPVVNLLSGWNDYAYVRASFRAGSQVVFVGQGYVGQYPSGEYTAGIDEFTLGMPTMFESLLPAPPAGQVRSGADVWIDPTSGDTHALAAIAGSLTYHHLPSGEAWSDHLVPVATLDDLFTARLLHEPGGPLVLVGAGATGLQARWADPAGAIDWTTSESLAIEIPAEGFAAPSAIHAMRPEYQTAPISGLHFAVCGQYAVSDGQIWHGELTL